MDGLYGMVDTAVGENVRDGTDPIITILLGVLLFGKIVVAGNAEKGQLVLALTCFFSGKGIFLQTA